MKKILLALVLILPLTVLTGCASFAEKLFNLPEGVLTKSIPNPVTPYMIYEVENGLTSVVAGLNIYKRNCWKSVPPGDPAPCKNTTRKLQSYTRKVPPLLERTKWFVDHNDQINARKVFDEVLATIKSFKETANKVGAIK